MARFAVAAEGPTDHPVLARLIATTLGREHAITEVFPDPDATTLDGRSPGGWSVLFDHLRHGGVEDALKKKNEPPLSDAKGEQKHPKRYEEVAKGYRKPKDLHRLGPRNPSLGIFLEALGTIDLDVD